MLPDRRDRMKDLLEKYPEWLPANFIVATLLLGSLLSGCGQKADLYLPERGQSQTQNQ